MRGAIAAGHPLTSEAGARVLREGGNAVDALLAAAFTAFVTEGPLTGPAGSGFMLVHAPGGETTVLECFFAAPTERLGEMEEVVIDFADSGTQVFHIGLGSVAVPGLLLGLRDAAAPAAATLPAVTRPSHPPAPSPDRQAHRQEKGVRLQMRLPQGNLRLI